MIDATRLRSGDLVFRRGRSRDSHMVAMLDPGASYSHVGLIDREGDSVFVIHVVPGTVGQADNVTRREPLEQFLAPELATAAAAYRIDEQYRTHAAAAVRAARSYVARHVPFDHDFDTESAARLYCTELVWRAYREAGVDLLDGRLETLALPFARGGYVFVSALRGSRYLRRVSMSRTRRNR